MPLHIELFYDNWSINILEIRTISFNLQLCKSAENYACVKTVDHKSGLMIQAWVLSHILNKTNIILGKYKHLRCPHARNNPSSHNALMQNEQRLHSCKMMQNQYNYDVMLFKCWLVVTQLFFITPHHRQGSGLAGVVKCGMLWNV